MRVGNIILASVLSLILTVLCVILYLFYPLIRALLRSATSEAGSGGIGAVSGGVSVVLLAAFLIVEPLLFLLTLVFLNRRHRSAR